MEEFESDICSFFHEVIGVMGFDRKEDIAYRERALGIFDVVSIEVVDEDGLVSLTPYVGIHFEKLHQKIAEIDVDTYEFLNPFTISIELGSLRPDKVFRHQVSRVSNWKCVVDEIVCDVRSIGLQYVERIKDYEDAIHEIEDGSYYWMNKGKYIGVLMFLCGKSPAEIGLYFDQYIEACRNDGLRSAGNLNSFRDRLLGRVV